jgi:IS30 family transposase
MELTDFQREVVEHLIDDLLVRDVAVRMGEPRSKVSSQMQRARDINGYKGNLALAVKYAVDQALARKSV